MAGRRGIRPQRAPGSAIPRIAGISTVVLLCAGGLAVYLSSAKAPGPVHPASRPTPKVLRKQAAGLVNPGITGSAQQGAGVPRMLLVTSSGLEFVPVPRSQLQVGRPQWITDQMTGGADVFIYLQSGNCLAIAGGPGSEQLVTSRCRVGPGQLWQPVNPGVTARQPFA